VVRSLLIHGGCVENAMEKSSIFLSSKIKVASMPNSSPNYIPVEFGVCGKSSPILCGAIRFARSALSLTSKGIADYFLWGYANS